MKQRQGWGASRGWRLAGERGSAMVLALLLLISLSILTSVYVAVSNIDKRITVNQTLAEKALYLTEIGWRAAYREFAVHNYRAMTHNADGSWPYTAMPLTDTQMPGLVLDDAEDNGLTHEMNNGDWVWERLPGDERASLSGTQLPESFRFRVHPATADVSDPEFVIEVVATLGKARREITVRGFTEPAFTYTFYADGDLGEFTRGVNQTIVGRVHANGDLCLAPDGSTLNLDVTSLTSTGNLFRYVDLWGRPANSAGVVKIKDADAVYQTMAWGAKGVAFDSFHPNWQNSDTSDAQEGAIERWGGVVRDGALGASPIEPPAFSSLEQGGYYEINAGLKLYAGDVQQDGPGNDVTGLIGSSVREVTFYNPSLGLDVTVQEIDVRDLQSRGLFPANGVIYSSQPVRIVNADSLAAPLTVVASNEIYTQGSFNTLDKKSAAIMTTGRVWHVSSNWNDDPSFTKNDVVVRQATNGTTTINAAVLDGVPVINEANYADLDGDGTPDGYPGTTWANCDFLLESWGSSRTLRKRGSIVHLERANMSEDPANNTLDEPGEIGWQRFLSYSPPYRDYGYDASLMGVSGQPPLSPLVSHITSWQETTP